jgi:hypothetical protein
MAARIGVLLPLALAGRGEHRGRGFWDSFMYLIPFTGLLAGPFLGILPSARPAGGARGSLGLTPGMGLGLDGCGTSGSKEVLRCRSKTRRWCAGTAGTNSSSLQGSRSSSNNGGSSTSLHAVPPAARRNAVPARPLARGRGRCIRRSAPPVARTRRCPLSPGRAAPFTAAIVSPLSVASGSSPRSRTSGGLKADCTGISVSADFGGISTRAFEPRGCGLPDSSP